MLADFNVTAGHKPKRRPYLLKKRPLTTGFFDTAKREEKGETTDSTSGKVVRYAGAEEIVL